MDVEIRETLLRARGLIEQGWTKGAMARNVDGESVSSYSPDACQWCLLGAIDACSDIDIYVKADCNELLRNAINELGYSSTLLHTRHPADFNDAANTTADMVIAVLDKAIEIAE